MHADDDEEEDTLLAPFLSLPLDTVLQVLSCLRLPSLASLMSVHRDLWVPVDLFIDTHLASHKAPLVYVHRGSMQSLSSVFRSGVLSFVCKVDVSENADLTLVDLQMLRLFRSLVHLSFRASATNSFDAASTISVARLIPPGLCSLTIVSGPVHIDRSESDSFLPFQQPGVKQRFKVEPDAAVAVAAERVAPWLAVLALLETRQRVALSSIALVFGHDPAGDNATVDLQTLLLFPTLRSVVLWPLACTEQQCVHLSWLRPLQYLDVTLGVWTVALLRQVFWPQPRRPRRPPPGVHHAFERLRRIGLYGTALTHTIRCLLPSSVRSRLEATEMRKRATGGVEEKEEEKTGEDNVDDPRPASSLPLVSSSASVAPFSSPSPLATASSSASASHVPAAASSTARVLRSSTKRRRSDCNVK